MKKKQSSRNLTPLLPIRRRSRHARKRLRRALIVQGVVTAPKYRMTPKHLVRTAIEILQTPDTSVEKEILMHDINRGDGTVAHLRQLNRLVRDQELRHQIENALLDYGDNLRDRDAFRVLHRRVMLYMAQ